MNRTVVASWAARLGLAVALVAIAWIAALPVVPPDPVPTSAPQDAFSEQRAMEDLRVVAREPHPVGSAAQGRVREYILAQAKALGLPENRQVPPLAAGLHAARTLRSWLRPALAVQEESGSDDPHNRMSLDIIDPQRPVETARREGSGQPRSRWTEGSHDESEGRGS